MTDGPNLRTCTQNCPNDATHPVKEQHKIRVDGLGREIERWDTTSDDGAIYTLYQMSTTSFVDTTTSTVPTSVTHQTRLDVDTTVPWKQEKTELDGHGRPTRQILLVQGTAPADQITSFSYRNDGTLQSGVAARGLRGRSSRTAVGETCEPGGVTSGAGRSVPAFS